MPKTEPRVFSRELKRRVIERLEAGESGTALSGSEQGSAILRAWPWAALESVRAITALIGLTPAQTFDAIRRYAQAGGVGARLYDRLIGEVALAHGVGTIVTWNISHMRGLFPSLSVVTPAAFRQRAGPSGA